MARIIAQWMSGLLRQPIIIANVGAADGLVTLLQCIISRMHREDIDGA
jgi:tripartite-type tricarboxylate transporter receptor subunit TctC